MKCTQCHDQHGSSGPKMLKADTVNELCFKCHAEKRGPFLWEHPPVAENCLTCHVPHGSNHGKLLSSKPPLLCQSCHDATRHPGTIYTKFETFPGSATSGKNRIIARGCLNCHTNIHGSNGPSVEGTVLCPVKGVTMRRQIFLPFLLSGLFSLSPAFADDQEDKFSGEISAQGTLTHINGNKAKFNEYGDMQNGLYGDVKIKYDDDKYYVDFYSRNMFYDTQSYNLEGGKWGAFKFNINYNEIPHNFTYDAQTLYSGAGTNNLTYPTHPPSTDTSTWNTFDYSTKRKDYGAGFKLDVLKPFFLDFSAAVDERAGIYPIGAAGTSPGGISLELPAPIDYKTNSINLLAGYVRNPLFISLGYFYSSFTDSNTSFNFRNPCYNQYSVGNRHIFDCRRITSFIRSISRARLNCL